MNIRTIFKVIILISLFSGGSSSCTDIPKIITDVNEMPDIYPDYIGVTVPDNIAELKFRMADGRKFRSETSISGDTVWTRVTVWADDSDTAVRYAPFPMFISHDHIDPYIAYRLIEPGYENWNDMGIYQRELSSYKETAIVTNEVNDKGCINCHTFFLGNPGKYLFHARGAGGGTVFVNGNDVKLVDLADVGVKMQGAYPAWHPGGRYVAFASCKTYQVFFLKGSQPVEVFDTASDIIIFDLKDNSTRKVPAFSDRHTLETFPAWSSDGGTLFCCCAQCDTAGGYAWTNKHYSLKAVEFHDGEFGGEPETIWSSDTLSVSFPRIKNDWLLFTQSDYGTFPIWHKEADLILMNLRTGEVSRPELLNSDDTESYHSWSSDGHWIVFSSRRDDRRFTRLYIAHFDGEGHFGKPFMLPQKNPEFNQWRLQSYNVPDFISGKVTGPQKSIKALFH